MLVGRIALEISDTLVKSEQDSVGSERSIQYRWIRRTGESFVRDRVGILAEIAKVRHQFDRQVLVKLELHVARIGTRRSSRANSAA